MSVSISYSMESALYCTYALIVFVSENPFVNTVRAYFPWSNLYFFSAHFSNTWTFLN